MSRLYTVSQYLSGIGLFSALLYFVGRRYLEQYFGIMSMPLEVMNLNYADYAYYGAQPIPLIITGLFTILGLKLWVLAFQKRTLPETTILKDSYGSLFSYLSVYFSSPIKNLLFCWTLIRR